MSGFRKQYGGGIEAIMRPSNNGIRGGIRHSGFREGFGRDSQGFRGIRRDSPIGIRALSLRGECQKPRHKNKGAQ